MGWAIRLGMVGVLAAVTGFSGAQTTTTAPTTTSRPASGVTTVAIIPFHCRSLRAHMGLATAISMQLGNTLRQGGRVTIVDREGVGMVMDEKTLADADMTDARELTRQGMMIAADYLVSGTFDIKDGRLTIQAQVMPTDKSDFGQLYVTMERDYPSAKVSGPVASAQDVIAQLGEKLLPAVPAGKVPPAHQGKEVKGSSLAVVDFIAMPTEKKLTGPAQAFAATLGQELEQAMGARLVERSRLAAVLDEHKLALAGLTDRGRSRMAAQLVGARYLAMGALTSGAKADRIDVQIIDVPTGVALAGWSLQAPAENLPEQAPKLAAELADELAGRTAYAAWLAENHKTHRSQEARVQAFRAGAIRDSDMLDEAQREALADSLLALAEDLDKDDLWVVITKGNIAKAREDYAEAERQYRRAITLAPNDPAPYRNLAFMLVKAERFADALAPARKACELDPKDRRPWGYVARALVGTGQFKDAEAAARKALSLGQDAQSMEALAESLNAQGQTKEAAEWYHRAGIRYDFHDGNTRCFRKAFTLYKQLGDTPKAMEMLQRVVCIDRDYYEWLELAEYYESVGRKREAAALAYVVANSAHHRDNPDRQERIRRAKALLQKMGLPEQQPLRTGAVFDIDQMRKKGISILLQPYEGFRYPEQLPFIKQLMEDVIGVPVVIAETTRPLVLANYDRQANRIEPDAKWARDLAAVAKETKATLVVGLCSHKMARSSSLRWPEWGHALVSTDSGDVRDVKNPPPEWKIAAHTFGGPERYLIKYPLLGLVAKADRRHQCKSDICSLSMFRWDPYRTDLFPCDDCAAMLRASRPDWPAGAEDRPPIVAGPAQPATTGVKGKVLIVNWGIAPDKSRSAEVAEMIRMSLGLDSVVMDVPQLKAQPSEPQYGLKWTAALPEFETLDLIEKNPLAVVVIADQSIVLPWGRWTHFWPAGDPSLPRNVKCPMVLMGLGLSTNALTLGKDKYHLEPITLGEGDKARTLQVPQYAKMIVGDLALAMKKSHECWTLGCPATAGEFVGVPRRCSYWLCPQCRKAVAEHFAPPNASAGW